MANVEFVHVPCKNCNRPVRSRTPVPAVVFCSIKCNKAYVAREGVKAQEEAYGAGRSISGDEE